jgi:hypothetical protein
MEWKSTRGVPRPEPTPRLCSKPEGAILSKAKRGYQAPCSTDSNRNWSQKMGWNRTDRVRVRWSGSLSSPCSTSLDRSQTLEDRCRTGQLRVGRSGSPTHCETGQEPDPCPSCHSGLGLGRSRTRCQTRPAHVWLGQAGTAVRQEATSKDEGLSPDGPAQWALLRWILNEPSRGGRVRRPCPCSL